MILLFEDRSFTRCHQKLWTSQPACWTERHRQLTTILSLTAGDSEATHINWPTSFSLCGWAGVTGYAESHHILPSLPILTPLGEIRASLSHRDRHAYFHVIEVLIKHNARLWESETKANMCLCVSLCGWVMWRSQWERDRQTKSKWSNSAYRRRTSEACEETSRNKNSQRKWKNKNIEFL